MSIWVFGRDIKAGMRVCDNNIIHTIKEVYVRRISGLGTKHIVQMAVVGNHPDLHLWRNEQYRIETS